MLYSKINSYKLYKEPKYNDIDLNYFDEIINLLKNIDNKSIIDNNFFKFYEDFKYKYNYNKHDFINLDKIIYENENEIFYGKLLNGTKINYGIVINNKGLFYGFFDNNNLYRKDSTFISYLGYFLYGKFLNFFPVNELFLIYPNLNTHGNFNLLKNKIISDFNINGKYSIKINSLNNNFKSTCQISFDKTTIKYEDFTLNLKNSSNIYEEKSLKNNFRFINNKLISINKNIFDIKIDKKLQAINTLNYYINIKDKKIMIIKKNYEKKFIYFMDYFYCYLGKNIEFNICYIENNLEQFRIKFEEIKYFPFFSRYRISISLNDQDNKYLYLLKQKLNKINFKKKSIKDLKELKFSKKINKYFINKDKFIYPRLNIFKNLIKKEEEEGKGIIYLDNDYFVLYYSFHFVFIPIFFLSILFIIIFIITQNLTF